MNQNFVIIITLLGGLSVFIYGMIMMSGGLQKVAGERMKSFLAIFTRNRVIGALAGAMVTVVLQSSSATTVMVVGFVSAGLIKLPQAISVILGANIGTTVTAQLIAFKVGDFAWIFVALGFILYFFVKRENIKNVGESIFAFGLLFVGINTMGNAMAPLSQSEGFSQLILNVSDIPALGVAVGAGLTVVVQASAAVIAVLQKLASTMGPDGVNTLIGLEGAIPVLFGTNIGTTITAILASFGASVNAKRAALAHVLFNLSGTIAFMFFIPLYTKAVLFISPIGTEIEVISRQIANAHFLFIFIATLLWLPFVGVLVKVVTKLIPGEDQVKPSNEPVVLDHKVINTPLFALHLAAKVILRIADFVCEMIKQARQ
ncbi:MAG: Na/Pi cotransporter family protein, partial [Clostridiales bacterium]|nr:Na/Pi cotransporter family protein [Clostridiales bacterium]